MKPAFLVAIATLMSAAPAAAGPAVDAAQRAEALIVEGKPIEALEALEQAEDALWQWAPLAFRKTAFVTSFNGYHDYEERADGTFRPDEEMLIYAEPIGFGYGNTGGGASVDFTVDLAVENATGQVVSETDGLFDASFETGSSERNFAFTLKLTAPYLRPGDYTATFTVKDKNSEKSASFEMPFTLTLPAEASAPKQ